jgi:hypothetical protein
LGAEAIKAAKIAAARSRLRTVRTIFMTLPS